VSEGPGGVFLILMMNFFQRRKVLKNANYLQLIPVRMMEYQMEEQGTVTILLPRFKNNYWREVYRNSKKGEYIFIRFDHLGSSIWQLIDGKQNVDEICTLMKEIHSKQLHPIEETEKRVTQFLSLLYQQRYISFVQLLNEKKS
jgi:hypothetical protein